MDDLEDSVQCQISNSQKTSDSESVEIDKAGVIPANEKRPVTPQKFFVLIGQ